MGKPVIKLHLFNMRHTEAVPPAVAKEINRATIRTAEFPPAAADPLAVELIPDNRSYVFVRTLLDRVPGITPVDRSPYHFLHMAETQSKGAVIAQPLAAAVLKKGWPHELMQWLVMPVLHRAFQVARDKEMALAIKEQVDGYLKAHPDVDKVSVSHVQGGVHDGVPHFLKALGCKLEVVEHNDPRYKDTLRSPLGAYVMDHISVAELEDVFKPVPQDPEVLQRFYMSGRVIGQVDYNKLAAVFDKFKQSEVRKVLVKEKKFMQENPQLY